MQTWQEEEAGALNLPELHTVQAEELPDPTLGLYLPPKQSIQIEAPAPLLCFPTGQFTQSSSALS